MFATSTLKYKPEISRMYINVWPLYSSVWYWPYWDHLSLRPKREMHRVRGASEVESQIYQGFLDIGIPRMGILSGDDIGWLIYWEPWTLLYPDMQGSPKNSTFGYIWTDSTQAKKLFTCLNFMSCCSFHKGHRDTNRDDSPRSMSWWMVCMYSLVAWPASRSERWTSENWPFFVSCLYCL